MIAVDTNVIVRLITGDDAPQGKKARDLFAGSTVYVTTTVFLETEWVLRKIYGIDRVSVTEALLRIAENERVVVEDPARVRAAIEGYRVGLDFADALHVAGAADAEAFATFDRALARAAPSAFAHPPVISP
ncbi:MAG: type II toxin-antitoxin system VapC family toxin [Phreatobacter sp.]